MNARVLRSWVLGVALGGAAFVAVPAFADEPAASHAEVAAQGTGAERTEEGAGDEEHAVPKLEEYNFF
jgi:hypothetical protein